MFVFQTFGRVDLQSEELAQLRHLLHLEARERVGHLHELVAAGRAVVGRAERLERRLDRVHVAHVEPGRLERAAQRVEGGRRPLLVLRVPVGRRDVARELGLQLAGDVRHAVDERVSDLRGGGEVVDPGLDLAPGGRAELRRLVRHVLELLDLILVAIWVASLVSCSTCCATSVMFWMAAMMFWTRFVGSITASCARAAFCGARATAAAATTAAPVMRSCRGRKR